MSAISTEEQKALTLTERAAVALGETVNAVKLRALAEQSKGIVVINSADGREEAHRAAMVLRTTRNNITNTGKAAREDATAFSKAVIAMEREMIAIIEPEEERVISLRDAWDADIAAAKAAKIAAERARRDAIQARLDAVRKLPADTAGKSAADISQMIYELAGTASQDGAYAATFEEFADEFKAVRTSVLELLAQAERKQLDIEATAAAAEAARLAEIERMAAERAELARLRAEADERDRLAKIESDRVAAEQAAEAKRLRELAAAQEAELQKLRDAEAARARAAQAEQDRVAAEAKRQMEAQQAAIAAERRVLEEQKAEAARAEQARIVAEELRIQIAADHDEALAMNAQFNTDREAERVRLQALADQQRADGLAQASDERAAGLPDGALGADALADITITDDLTDGEIVRLVADAFDLTILAAVERLAAIDFDAARELAAA